MASSANTAGTLPDDNGIFVRSPITADGVKVSEADRRKAEAGWIKREEDRDKARQKRDGSARRARTRRTPRSPVDDPDDGDT